MSNNISDGANALRCGEEFVTPPNEDRSRRMQEVEGQSRCLQMEGYQTLELIYRLRLDNDSERIANKTENEVHVMDAMLAYVRAGVLDTAFQKYGIPPGVARRKAA